jgi:hypothetical protein
MHNYIDNSASALSAFRYNDNSPLPASDRAFESAVSSYTEQYPNANDLTPTRRQQQKAIAQQDTRFENASPAPQKQAHKVRGISID